MKDEKMPVQFASSQCEWLKENLIPTAPFNITYNITKMYGKIEWSDIKYTTEIYVIGNISSFACATIITGSGDLDWRNWGIQWDTMNAPASDMLVKLYEKHATSIPYVTDELFARLQESILVLSRLDNLNKKVLGDNWRS